MPDAIDKPTHAPACFASASVFSRDSDACKACQSFKPCSVATLETLQRLRRIINVEDLIRRHEDAREQARISAEKAQMPVPTQDDLQPVERKTKLEPVREWQISIEDEKVIARLKVKPKEVAVFLCKQGYLQRARGLLKKGVNPFAQHGPKYWAIACDMLLAGGFTKRDLRERLMKELACTEGSAFSYVSIVCAVLIAFKLAQASGESFVVMPA